MTLKYYGNEDTGLIQETAFEGIQTPQDLYRALSDIWCEYTCAPRMRREWSEENRTLGQCSVTSFLAQDIFGGDVYGIPLKEGGFHCFNVVDGHTFDLTSEQMTHPIDYKKGILQSREEHFLKQEKKERYLYLKEKLIEKMSEKTEAL